MAEDSSKRTGKQEEAAIAGPGTIAAQAADPRRGAAGIASGINPGDDAPTTTHLAGRNAVGTPGGTTGQAGAGPGAEGTSGMSGAPTNDASPFGGRTDTTAHRDRQMPDATETRPDPKTPDARG